MRGDRQGNGVLIKRPFRVDRKIPTVQLSDRVYDLLSHAFVIAAHAPGLWGRSG